MAFVARIGERFDVQGVPARWQTHVELEWDDDMWISCLENTFDDQAGRENRFADAVIENVSVSGAGVLAPMDPRTVIGARVTLTLETGEWFQAVIRRMLPINEVSWAFFGLEFLAVDDGFRDWLNEVVDHYELTPIY